MLSPIVAVVWYQTEPAVDPLTPQIVKLGAMSIQLMDSLHPAPRWQSSASWYHGVVDAGGAIERWIVTMQ